MAASAVPNYCEKIDLNHDFEMKYTLVQYLNTIANHHNIIILNRYNLCIILLYIRYYLRTLQDIYEGKDKKKDMKYNSPYLLYVMNVLEKNMLHADFFKKPESESEPKLEQSVRSRSGAMSVRTESELISYDIQSLECINTLKIESTSYPHVLCNYLIMIISEIISNYKDKDKDEFTNLKINPIFKYHFKKTKEVLKEFLDELKKILNPETYINKILFIGEIKKNVAEMLNTKIQDLVKKNTQTAGSRKYRTKKTKKHNRK
jgi:hypothetical protein